MKKSLEILIVLLVFLSVLAPVAAFSQEEVAVNADSGNAYRVGLTLFKSGKYSDAAVKFAESYKLDERNINALFAQGMALNKTGKYADAAVLFKQVLEKDPKHEKAHRLLPVALANSGKTDEALKAYNTGIEIFPDNYNLVMGKATMLMKLSKYKEAVPVLEKAASLDKDKVQILEKIIFAYKELGDLDKAYTTAKKVLAKDSTHARALVTVGDYNRVNENYDEALKAYEAASKNIDTKAYAEHYIDVIKQTLEEIEIEKEYQARLEAEKKK